MGPGSNPQKAAWKVRAWRRGSRSQPSPWQPGSRSVTPQPSDPQPQRRARRAHRATTAKLPRLLILLADPPLAAAKSSHPKGSQRPMGEGGVAHSSRRPDNS